jgi:DNA-binding transcriptional LysR family regulator
LPRYTVASELREGQLKSIPGFKIQDRSFGVWWVRGRHVSPWVQRTITWLKDQKL